MTDHYSTLGVQRGASQDEIKKAYRKMASQHHPDKGGDTATFQKVEEAYRTLSDDNARSAYDNPQHSAPFEPFMDPQGFESIFRHFGGGPFGDMFGHRRPQPQRNHTLNLATTITLEDAFNGKEVIANVTLPSGREQVINVKVPAGVNNGTVLRLAGMGDDSIPNVPRGDIHLSINVAPHPLFDRQGDDLVQEMNLSIWDAACGTTVLIKSIEGKELELTIPAGIQHDQTMNVQGYGMPNMQNTSVRGRLLIRVKLKVPTDLTETQKAAIRTIIS